MRPVAGSKRNTLAFTAMPGTSAPSHLRQPSPTSRGASKHAWQRRIERPKSAMTHAIIVKGGAERNSYALGDEGH
jgi:hypothetical protein